ncbi:MAG: hypothetical protein R3E66_13070 [bacterium]
MTKSSKALTQDKKRVDNMRSVVLDATGTAARVMEIAPEDWVRAFRSRMKVAPRRCDPAL